MDNVPRMLPEGCAAELDRASWVEPAIFALLRERVPAEAMDHTFNLGVGLVLAVREADAAHVIDGLNAAGESAWRLGRVVSGDRGVRFL